MNVLIIGSGAREHVIGWKLAQSSLLSKLFFAPGNAGTSQIGTNLNLPVPTLVASGEIWESYFQALFEECRENQVELVVVQNESPLSQGIADFLSEKGIKVFGPQRNAAKIETSKIWAAGFAGRFRLPTPASFSLLYPQTLPTNWSLPDNFLVVKKSGLAEGKGVVVASSSAEAHSVVNKFLQEGQAVLVQERLSGREISVHAFTDGKQVVSMPFACDYKKIGEGNSGANTGGIGSISEPRWVSTVDADTINLQTTKLVSSLRKEGITYKGVLYPGWIITENGPQLIEVNCRLGDPETQVLLTRMKGDLLKVLLSTVSGTLTEDLVDWSEQMAVCVVLCAQGYPDSKKIEIGDPISGLDSIPDDVLVFHAGTKIDPRGRVVTCGGRVLSVVALGETLEEARNKVYEAIKDIHFDGMYYRRDIALNV